MAELRDAHARQRKPLARPGTARENPSVLEVVVSGLVTGWAIAIPIGAVGAFLVTLTSRTSYRVGAAGALGIATVDGAYAALAVVAGASLSALLDPVATPLRIASVLALLVIAAVTAAHALATGGRPREAAPVPPARAFALFLGITAVNPTTVVYFAAVVLGNRDLVDTPAQGVAFVLAAFLASASWQLLLAGSGVALRRVATGQRGHLATGLVSAAVIGGLAVHTMLA
jgi:arginine exporter protein ArgO